MKALGVAVLAAMAVLASARPVTAHAILLRTDPPDGVTLSGSPHELRLSFTEAVIVELSTFELLDGDLKPVPVSSVQAAAGDASQILVTLPALSTDTFQLHWRTISRDDLHAVSGTLVFGIAGSDAGSSAVAAPMANPTEVVLNWLGFAAFAGLLGALAIRLVARRAAADLRSPAGEHGPAVAWLVDRRLLVIGRAAAAIGVASGVLTLAAEAVQVGPIGDAGATWAAMLGTGHAWRSLAIIAILLATVIVLSWVLTRTAGTTTRNLAAPSRIAAADRRQIVVAAALVGVLAALRALNGHAAAAAAGQPLPIVAGTIHTIAAGLWIGGLIALALTIAPLLGRGADARTLARGVLVRFGWLAASGLLAIVVSGLVMSGGLVRSIDALLFDAYGRVLLLKVGLAAGVAVIGLASALSLHPTIGRPVRTLIGRLLLSRHGTAAASAPAGTGRLALRVRAEAIGALGVVVLAATLAATPPAIGPEWSPVVADAAAIPTMSGEAADLVIALSVRPNRPGRNFVTATVHDTRRPAPAPIAAVVAHLEGTMTAGARTAAPTTLTLSPTGGGRYEASIDLPAGAAPLRVSVVTERPGLPDAVYSTDWSLLPAIAQPRIRPVVVSNQPLSPLVNGAAAGLLVLVAGWLAIRWLRGPRRPWLLAVVAGSHGPDRHGGQAITYAVSRSPASFSEDGP
jgi:copper transport protein